MEAVPDAILGKVLEVFKTIPWQAGGYGRVVIIRAGSAVHPTAKNTAMALLIRMRFLQEYKPKEWLNSAKWILESQIKKLEVAEFENPLTWKILRIWRQML